MRRVEISINKVKAGLKFMKELKVATDNNLLSNFVSSERLISSDGLKPFNENQNKVIE